MAILNNNQESSTTEAKQFLKGTGACIFEIKGVNYTNEKAKKEGHYVKDGSPEFQKFSTTKTGKEVANIKLYGEVVYTIDGTVYRDKQTLSFMLEKDYSVSMKTGTPKYKFINQFWKTTWAFSPEQVIATEESKVGKDIKMGKNIRKCYGNEDVLMELLGKANGVINSVYLSNKDKTEVYENKQEFKIDAKWLSDEWFKEVETYLVNRKIGVIMVKETYTNQNGEEKELFKIFSTYSFIPMLTVNKKGELETPNEYLIKQFNDAIKSQEEYYHQKGESYTPPFVTNSNLLFAEYKHNTFTPTQDGNSELPKGDGLPF